MKIEILESKKIQGTVNISGSKNAALGILAASLLTMDEVILLNVPMIEDTIKMMKLMELMGSKITIKDDKIYILTTKLNTIITSSLVNEFRASYYLMGASLAREKCVVTSTPGGCNFGFRPIDFHLEAFAKMGCDISFNNEEITIVLKKKKNTIHTLKKPSVGTTINILILASSLDKISTIINNIVLEPEIIDVIRFLKRMGANIQTIGNSRIKIIGRKKLHGTKYSVMFDRMEAGSMMLLTASVPTSNVTIKGVNPFYMAEVISIIKKLGAKINCYQDSITIASITVLPIDLVIKEYPSFPTDLQQILTVVLLQSKEISHITDLIYPNRISHINELNTLGAKIELSDNTIIIKPSILNGNNVIARDLRCAFALIVAGVIAKGKTTIDCTEILFRGYEDIIEKLKAININISIVENE